MIKLPVNKTKWSSLLTRTGALILYISIWIFDFGPEKLPGLSRNGPQAATSRSRTSFATRNSSPHYSSIFTSISVSPVLDTTYLLPLNRCSHCTKVLHLSDMWFSTFEIGATQLDSVTEIAPPKPFLCVNRSHLRYEWTKKEEFNKYAVLLYFRAQLFEGRLALNRGLNLTRVSFSCVQKHFLG